jgi:putative oxidoreductase
MIKTLLAPHADRAYALLRIVAGLLFAFHGALKPFGILLPLGGFHPSVGSQLWVGGVIEFVGGIAIALGAQARWAAFIASGTMAVAYFQFHWKFRFDSNVFPAVNMGEPAVVYCFLFLLIACQGAGPWSVDARRAARQASHP